MGIKVIGKNKRDKVLYERNLSDDSSISSIKLSLRVAKSIKGVKEVFVLQDTNKTEGELSQANWKKLANRYNHIQLNTDGTFSLMGIAESGKSYELWRMTVGCLQVFQKYLKYHT